jgi:hypothetical protein
MSQFRRKSILIPNIETIENLLNLCNNRYICKRDCLVTVKNTGDRHDYVFFSAFINLDTS